ncbi:MAG TPA: hypothetical protein PK864_09880 [Syntrophorhabdaceae bacterium]|nr:hypothetical protein [Syntrophorhabdaceae bacterium]HON86316.1 hypothetical protein [Syntrophorhabdaceae bacterium]HOT42697.1 hypothetical protein [Syntrophorhabdaceae bacterium]HPC67620.1 hypothetical protein [Syntrophorhabdaceae bacterium]HQE80904.1 hypothetical protein [Syntrophorhabdaceae bacterium]
MAASKKIRRYIQDPLFEELRKDTCYLCQKRIKRNDGIKVGKNLWRHKKCNPIHFSDKILPTR